MFIEWWMIAVTVGAFLTCAQLSFSFGRATGQTEVVKNFAENDIIQIRGDGIIIAGTNRGNKNGRKQKTS